MPGGAYARVPTSEPRLFAVVGATGTGKSALSLALADELAARGEPAEVVNADAMQLYRGMDIGTAKVSVDERRGIPHHLFDVLNVDEEASVAAYQVEARRTVEQIHARGAHAILVGGSGLYVSSVLFDLSFPPRDEAVRAELAAELEAHGPGMLFARLQAWDPATAARIDARNGRRIVRALEVLAQGGPTHGAVLPDSLGSWRPATVIGLRQERARLVAWLDARVEQMWARGLLEEVVALRDRGLERGTTARRAIGYAQALAQISDEIDQDVAISRAQALTRRYARRQVAWFHRYAGVRWVQADAAADPPVVRSLLGA